MLLTCSTQIHTECLSEDELALVYTKLDELWAENTGTNVVYIWVEAIRSFLTERYEMAKQFIESTEEEKERESKLTLFCSENLMISIFITLHHLLIIKYVLLSLSPPRKEVGAS